jgi:ElaB/YqjD/DUF883 family membrane-anchored ribosome-binding protein
MAMMTGTTTVKEAIKDRLTPALETFKENKREATRAILHGRHAAEDFIAETALQVRRHPLHALAIVAGAGTLAGCLIGFALGRRVRG